MEKEMNNALLQRQWFCEALGKELKSGELLFIMDKLQEEESMCYDLFRTITGRSECAAYSIILCVKQLSKTIQTKYEEMSGVSVTEYGSQEFVHILASAEIIISNTVLPLYYARRKGQQYVNVPGQKEDLLVSQLLNTTCLLSRGPAYTKRMYEQRCRLHGIYQGIVLERGVETKKEYLDKVVNVVLYHEMASIEGLLVWKRDEKQHLLFVIDIEKEPAIAWEWYKAMLNHLVEDDYDVTLLSPKKETAQIKAKITGLKRGIHLVYKQGAVSYDGEGEKQLEVMREAFLHSEKIEEVVSLRPAKYFRLEWQRLLGGTTFDYSYLVSPQSVFWQTMFLELTSEEIFLLQEKVPRQDNGYRIGIYYDRVVAMNLEVYRAFLESGEIEERKVELFDTDYCLLRSDSRFLSVQIAGKEYLECGIEPVQGKVQQGVYVKAPAIFRTSYFLSIQNLPEGIQKKVILGCLNFLQEEEDTEVYVEAGDIAKMNAERLVYLPKEVVSVELLERLDVIMSITQEAEYKYCYIAALIKKPYGTIQIKEESQEEITRRIKELLETRGTYCDGKKEGRYLQFQKEEMRKLLY